MATLSMLVTLWLAICCCVNADDASFTFGVHRDVGDKKVVDAVSKIRQKQSGNVPSIRGKSLYWFGNFSVGDSGPLKLVIDTGSTDILVDPGLYQPSSQVKPYGTGNFTITYEGVNRAGFGFETLNGTTTMDRVTAEGLTVSDQAVGNITSYKYIAVPPLPYAIQGQGIIGFLGSGSSSFNPPSPSWFSNLCKGGALRECRFGLAFGTSGEGLTIVGELAKKYILGGLTTVHRMIQPYHAFTVIGDVTIDNKIVATDQTIITDVGTDNIQGPIGVTKKIFSILGYQTSLKTSSDNAFDPGQTVKVLTAFFECNKPPVLGFSFPAKSQLKRGQQSKIFNVSPLVWDVYDHGDNNCTSILGGTNALTDPKSHTSAWLLGQPFYAGHYVDHDIIKETIGFGDLKDPSMTGCT